MSAFAAIAYEDRVEVIADGAIVDQQNRLVLVEQKVLVSEHIPLAFSVRGQFGLCKLLWWELERIAACGSFDETIAAYQDYLTNGTSLFRERKMGSDAVIAGISESAGPVLGWFTTWEGQNEVEPYLIIEPGAYCSGSPEPSKEVLAEAGFPDRFQNERLSECGADLMETVRQTPIDRDGVKAFSVGGHVDCAIIDANGSRVERLRTWPDEIGKPINPECLSAAA